MFKLANNNKINYESILDAMLDFDENNIYWFDNETGECLLEKELIKDVGKTSLFMEKEKRYFQILKISKSIRLESMSSFISDFIENEDSDFAEKLKKIIQGRNPFDDFIKELKNSSEAWIFGWNSWENDLAFDEMKKWFDFLPFDIKEEMEYFCDCPICESMKEGKTSESDLKSAFRETNFNNIVSDIYHKQIEKVQYTVEEKYIKDLIEIIKTGTRDEVKKAQKQVEVFWKDVYIPNRKIGRKAFEVFLEEIKHFEEIKDIDHQSYFINTIKWPLWSTGEANFGEWSDFLFKYIQHPSGKIRQAIIRATDYLIADLRLDLKDDFEIVKSSGMKYEEFKELVEDNKMRFGSFVFAVENLFRKYHEPRFNRYKYIGSLPTSVYKSLHMLITESLLRSEFYEKIYDEFLVKIRSNKEDYKLPKIIKEDILNDRKKMEEDLLGLIKKTKSSLSLEKIKEMIYNEDGNDVMRELIAIFQKGQDNIDELNKIMKILASAWNHWPHKKLNGLSPAEKVLEIQEGE